MVGCCHEQILQKVRIKKKKIGFGHPLKVIQDNIDVSVWQNLIPLIKTPHLILMLHIVQPFLLANNVMHLHTPYHSNWYAHSLGIWTPWEHNLQLAANVSVEHWQASAVFLSCLQRQQNGQRFTEFVTLGRGCSAVALPPFVC